MRFRTKKLYSTLSTYPHVENSLLPIIRFYLAGYTLAGSRVNSRITENLSTRTVNHGPPCVRQPVSCTPETFYLFRRTDRVRSRRNVRGSKSLSVPLFSKLWIRRSDPISIGNRLRANKHENRYGEGIALHDDVSFRF